MDVTTLHVAFRFRHRLLDVLHRFGLHLVLLVLLVSLLRELEGDVENQFCSCVLNPFRLQKLDNILELVLQSLSHWGSQ